MKITVYLMIRAVTVLKELKDVSIQSNNPTAALVNASAPERIALHVNPRAGRAQRQPENLGWYTRIINHILATQSG